MGLGLLYQLFLSVMMTSHGFKQRPRPTIAGIDVYRGQLAELELSQRSAVVDRMLQGEVLINPSVESLHGDVGLTADGYPLFLPLTSPVPDKSMATLLREGGGFNLELSNRLPLERVIPESRHPQCLDKDYYKDSSGFSKASVVIVFYNEPFSTLARSIHSVFQRTPPRELVWPDVTQIY